MPVDDRPGDTNGQNSRDVWYVLSTDSGPIWPSATVQTSEHPELGTILTDASGRTLYLFTPDERDISNCAGGCALAWPPLVTIDEPVAGDGVTGDLLGTAAREGGYTQATYNGWPLYYFVFDEKPGDTNGQNSGDVWFVVTPAGEAGPTEPPAPEPPSVGDGILPLLVKMGLIAALVLLSTGGFLLFRSWSPRN